ncbi:MAG TPA: MFS transporter [Acidobacteriaceae bacterium]|nr:MFS transporter [Acidobacteriaceae bacterium]
MKQIVRKITARLLPFLMLLYVVAFLDRVNVGFAALSMNHALGISDSFYGFAAGMFFVGYFVCEVPSNLLLNRYGARVWITRIMITWGLLSICTAFVRGGGSYVALRFLLGAAEAGFFPGIILYLTFWLPASRRAGVLSLFVVAIPLANIVGSPLSAAILRVQGRGGLQGWQWLFLLEGLPSVVLGGLVPLFLADSPQKASWLTSEEKAVLASAFEAEKKTASESPAHGWRGMISGAFVGLTFTYFTLMTGLYGFGFWLPRILQAAGSSPQSIGWDAAIPYVLGGALGVMWAYHSELTDERRWHLFASFVAAAIGVLVVCFFPSKVAVISGFTCSAAGIFSAMPLFWTVATKSTLGVAAASGIAVINSIGNLGGFVGPFWMGWMSKLTHSFAVGLLSIAFVLAAGALTICLISQEGSQGRKSLEATSPRVGA